MSGSVLRDVDPFFVIIAKFLVWRKIVYQFASRAFRFQAAKPWFLIKNSTRCLFSEAR
jgi:hypothetical protein